MLGEGLQVAFLFQAEQVVFQGFLQSLLQALSQGLLGGRRGQGSGSGEVAELAFELVEGLAALGGGGGGREEGGLALLLAALAFRVDFAEEPGGLAAEGAVGHERGGPSFLLDGESNDALGWGKDCFPAFVIAEDRGKGNRRGLPVPGGMASGRLAPRRGGPAAGNWPVSLWEWGREDGELGRFAWAGPRCRAMPAICRYDSCSGSGGAVPAALALAAASAASTAASIS